MSSKWFNCIVAGKTAGLDTAGVTSRIFCFPHAGGDATPLAKLVSKCLPNVQVIAVIYPGRGRRSGEKPITVFNDLVATIIQEFRPLLQKGCPPFALLGHSLGSLVAFEATLRLNGMCCFPRALILSACTSPNQPRKRNKPPISSRSLKGVVEHLRKLGGTPEEVLANDELMEMFLPCIKGDYSLVETYKYSGSKVRCSNVLLVGGDSDDSMTTDIGEWKAVVAIEKGVEKSETTEAEKKEAAPTVITKLFKGGHFYYQETPEAAQFIATYCGRVLA